MSDLATELVWHRSPDVAVVDDGERIVLLPLAFPTASAPQLLGGAAASIWRAINGQRTTADIVRAVCTGGESANDLSARLKSITGFLEALQDIGALTARPPETSFS